MQRFSSSSVPRDFREQQENLCSWNTMSIRGVVLENWVRDRAGLEGIPLLGPWRLL